MTNYWLAAFCLYYIGSEVKSFGTILTQDGIMTTKGEVIKLDATGIAVLWDYTDNTFYYTYSEFAKIGRII